MRIALTCLALATLAIGCSDDASSGNGGAGAAGGSGGAAGSAQGGSAGSSGSNQGGSTQGGNAGMGGAAGASGAAGTSGAAGAGAGGIGGSAGAAAGGSAGATGGAAGAAAGGAGGTTGGTGGMATGGAAGSSGAAGSAGTGGSGGAPSAFCAAKPTGTRCARGTQDVFLVGGVTSGGEGQVNVHRRSDGAFVRSLFKGGLLTPSRVYQGPDNCIYVAGFSELTVWDTDGSMVGEHFVGQPLGIGFFGGNVYVGRTDKIDVFSDLAQTGTTYANEAAHFIHFRTDGSAWVSQASFGTNRVALLAAGGGSFSDLLTGVDDPMQIAEIGTDQFLVSLAGDARVAELNGSGTETASTATPGLNPVGAQLLDNGDLLVSSSNPPDFDGGGTYGVFTATRNGSAVTSLRSMAISSNIELTCL
ncbi:MAG: hypothetical protein AB7K71_01830 [Polyangiaceae bacterium]